MSQILELFDWSIGVVECWSIEMIFQSVKSLIFHYSISP
jgi:hypothetical protein